MTSLLLVPRANANDDEVIVVEWLMGEGDVVRADSLVCSVETTKAVIDVEAGAAGYLRPLVAVGTRVGVGSVLAAVTADADSPLPDAALPGDGAADDAAPPSRAAASRPPVDGVPAPTASPEARVAPADGRRWTRKAEIVAARLGVDLAALATTLGREIGEADVRAAAAEPSPTPSDATPATTSRRGPVRVAVVGSGPAVPQVLEMISRLPQLRAVGVVGPDGADVLGVPPLGSEAEVADLVRRGALDAAALAASSGTDRSRILRLLRAAGVEVVRVVDPSAVVAADVVLGAGVIVGPQVVLGPGTVLGDGCLVAAGAVLEHANVCGAAVTVGAGSVLGAGARIGDDTELGARVVIAPASQVAPGTAVPAGTVVADVPAR